MRTAKPTTENRMVLDIGPMRKRNEEMKMRESVSVKELHDNVEWTKKKKEEHSHALLLAQTDYPIESISYRVSRFERSQREHVKETHVSKCCEHTGCVTVD